MDPWSQFWAKMTPTEFSFTVMAFMVVSSAIYAIVFRWFPDFIKAELPARRELRKMKAQADADFRREELAEQRLMRQTLDRIGGVNDRIALLLELHDKQARSGIDQILALLRIVLEKQGVATSEIERFVREPNSANEVVAKLTEMLQPKATVPA